MRCAVIENNIVVNLIVADDPALFGAIPSETASIGDLWDGETFMPPTPPAPLSVARAQGKAALIGAGMWPSVLAFVAAIPDETQRLLAEVALHDTQHWQRNSPFLNAAKSGLGMTDEQLDALFVAAAQIEL